MFSKENVITQRKEKKEFSKELMLSFDFVKTETLIYDSGNTARQAQTNFQ